MRSIVLSLSLLFMAVPASAQFIMVPDITVYGVPDNVVPVPVMDLDGDTSTMEFLLYPIPDEKEEVRADLPSLFNPVNGCSEPLPNPWSGFWMSHEVIGQRVVMRDDGTFLASTGRSVLNSAEIAYRFEPLRFAICGY